MHSWCLKTRARATGELTRRVEGSIAGPSEILLPSWQLRFGVLAPGFAHFPFPTKPSIRTFRQMSCGGFKTAFRTPLGTAFPTPLGTALPPPLGAAAQLPAALRFGTSTPGSRS